MFKLFLCKITKLSSQGILMTARYPIQTYCLDEFIINRWIKIAQKYIFCQSFQCRVFLRLLQHSLLHHDIQNLVPLWNANLAKFKEKLLHEFYSKLKLFKSFNVPCMHAGLHCRFPKSGHMHTCNYNLHTTLLNQIQCQLYTLILKHHFRILFQHVK